MSLQQIGLRHRVEARVFMKWVTLCNAFECIPSTLTDAMFHNGFFGVLRAGGIEATVVERKKRRDEQLINPNEGNEQASHGLSERCWSKSFRRVAIA